MQSVLTEAIPQAVAQNGGAVDGLTELVLLCGFSWSSRWHVRRIARGLAEQGVIEIKSNGPGRGHKTLYVLPRKHQRQKRCRKASHE